MGDATTLVNIVQRIGGAVGAVSVVVLLAQSAHSVVYVWGFAALLLVSVLTLVSGAVLRHQGAASDPSFTR